MTDVTQISVRPPGDSSYDVLVGHDLLGGIAPLLTGVTRVGVIFSAALRATAERVAEGLGDVETHLIEVPDGEEAKALASADRSWNALGDAGFTRNDAIVGVGGGATTDLAGFVAATWLRGLRVVHVPTTLLGMVDAAVGGKTAINSGAGKNLVGAFHQPAGVICDLTTLDTLPEADFRAGLAEIVKAGFIADPEILDLLDDDPTGRRNLQKLVERSIQVKAEVVSDDPNEAGRREILNYGHTLAHAIEKVERYSWRHGDAVSVGLCYAAALGRLAGRLDAETAARHGAVLQRVGLPVTYSGGNWDDLHAAMAVDKKSRGRRLRFIVLDGLAKPGVLDAPADDLLLAAFAEVTA
jgi:3-dehydroquinate synthase